MKEQMSARSICNGTRDIVYQYYSNGTRAIVCNYNMNTVGEWEANGWKLEGTYYGSPTFWKNTKD